MENINTKHEQGVITLTHSASLSFATTPEVSVLLRAARKEKLRLSQNKGSGTGDKEELLLPRELLARPLRDSTKQS